MTFRSHRKSSEIISFKKSIDKKFSKSSQISKFRSISVKWERNFFRKNLISRKRGYISNISSILWCIGLLLNYIFSILFILCARHHHFHRLWRRYLDIWLISNKFSLAIFFFNFYIRFFFCFFTSVLVLLSFQVHNFNLFKSFFFFRLSSSSPSTSPFFWNWLLLFYFFFTCAMFFMSANLRSINSLILQTLTKREFRTQKDRKDLGPKRRWQIVIISNLARELKFLQFDKQKEIAWERDNF